MSLEPLPQGTITSPRGYLAGACYAGIKTAGEKVLDLGVLYSEASCQAAGLFTTNKVKAAPVLVSQHHLDDGRAQAIVVNSGCANAATGERGLKDAATMATLVGRKLGVSPQDVVVASTGVIGVPLPMDKIGAAVEKIALSRDGGHDLARAITTTDTFPKEVAFSRDGMVVAGIAKGAGMIHPNLATLLCFLSTDANLELGFMKRALHRAVDVSFNMITIDGDTSTNDTVVLLANGLASGEKIEEGTSPGGVFEEMLKEVCIHLAKAVARDGEGATKLITVTVEGALTATDARAAARTVVGSPLVKAAVHGNDPNWGRLLAAVGRSGAEMEESKLDLFLSELCLTKGGCPQPFDMDAAVGLLKGAEVSFRIYLNLGGEKATAWGCDLSEEYVTINSTYST